MSILKVKLESEDYDFQKDGNFKKLIFGISLFDNDGTLPKFSTNNLPTLNFLKIVKIQKENLNWIESDETDLTSQIANLLNQDTKFTYSLTNSFSENFDDGIYVIKFGDNAGNDYKTEPFCWNSNITITENAIIYNTQDAILYNNTNELIYK